MTPVENALVKPVHEHYIIESINLHSEYLDRTVVVDVYLPKSIVDPSDLSLLIINDGQDLPKMPFAPILNQLVEQDTITPVLAVGIHCNIDRKLEYGTADVLDYMNRGARAKFHRKFIINELLPFIRSTYYLPVARQTAFAGFSLGGLSAMDIVWTHPEIFNTAAVFSGSFWWRSKDLNNGYDDATDRIMHNLVRKGDFSPGLKFFFQTGRLDETMDRNNNGIIDSIDDTLDLIAELEKKGYKLEKNIKYLELSEGKHDVPTWASAFPEFLKWSYAKENLL